MPFLPFCLFCKTFCDWSSPTTILVGSPPLPPHCFTTLSSPFPTFPPLYFSLLFVFFKDLAAQKNKQKLKVSKKAAGGTAINVLNVPRRCFFSSHLSSTHIVFYFWRGEIRLFKTIRIKKTYSFSFSQ